MDSPRVLTGNFGELRPNHFHTGLDFSTNGEENLQVYAIDDGFVSRIRVSPVGYGKAVYITHSNGRVSVYAHLNAFSLKINNAVKVEQYAKQNYEVDFYPKPWSIYVRKNEIIGLSGNTGGSSGPHLHFELRDEKTEVTINPLTVYQVEDQISPVLQEISLYNLQDTLQPMLIRSINPGNTALKKDTILLPGNIIGLAFAAYDQYLLNGNQNNVYAAKLFLDNEIIYHHEFNTMDFADFRYVNEYCVPQRKKKFQKCFLPGLYPSYLYPTIKNKGRIFLNDQNAHFLRLTLSDESGNTKEWNLYIRASEIQGYKIQNKECDIFVPCSKDTSFVVKNFRFHFPPNCLFNPLALSVEETAKENTLKLIPSNTPLRSAINFGMKVPEKFRKDVKGLVLKTEQGFVVPELSNDSLWFAVKQFGTFQLLVDNAPPTAKRLVPSRKKTSKKSGAKLEFFLSDDLSGLGKYALYVNKEWVIAEYDAKSHILSYSHEDSSLEGEAEVQLQIQDKVGNRSEFNYTIRL